MNSTDALLNVATTARLFHASAGPAVDQIKTPWSVDPSCFDLATNAKGTEWAEGTSFRRKIKG